jgi:MFS family permease
LPGACALAVFGMMGGHLLNRVGERVMLIIGTWILFAGAITLHLGGVAWSPWNVSLLYVVVASGYGMVNAAAIKAATDQLPEELSGVGVGVFNLFFFLGGAVAVAIAGAIVRNREFAPAPWDHLFTGVPIAYSDAMLVVVGFALAGFSLAVAQRPRAKTPVRPTLPVMLEPSGIAGMPVAALPVTGGPPAWANHVRAKPNSAARTRATASEVLPVRPERRQHGIHER